MFSFSGERRPVSTVDPHIVFVSRWAADRLGGKLAKVIRAEEQVEIWSDEMSVFIKEAKSVTLSIFRKNLFK